MVPWVLLVGVLASSILAPPRAIPDPGASTTRPATTPAGPTEFVDPDLRAALEASPTDPVPVVVVVQTAAFEPFLAHFTTLFPGKPYRQFYELAMVSTSIMAVEFPGLVALPGVVSVWLDSAKQAWRSGAGDSGLSQATGPLVAAPRTGAASPAPVNVTSAVNASDVAGALGASAPINGSKVVVAILDTGLDVPGHVEGDLVSFTENGTLTGAKLFGSVSLVPYEPLYYTDFHGSGTYHAGVAAGTGYLNASFPGVAPGAFLLNVKVRDSAGLTYYSFVLAGMEYALAHGADVACIPWSIPGYHDDPLCVGVDRLVDRGVVVVVPAGDDGPSYTSVGSPGQALRAISVGAVGLTTNEVAAFSSRGPAYDMRPCPDLVAPGVNVAGPRVRLVSNLSAVLESMLATANQSGVTIPGMDSLTIPGLEGLNTTELFGMVGNATASLPTFGTPLDENYTTHSSTSAACAVVAGAVALLLDAYPLATPESLKTALLQTARPLTTEWNVEGAGVIDVASAARYLQGHLDDQVPVPARVPNSLFYPGGLSSMDVYNVTRLQNGSSTWDPYDLFAVCSTQAMVPLAGIHNGSDPEFLSLHLPLNQFAVKTSARGVEFFSEFEVVREFHNITAYHALEHGGYTRCVGVLKSGTLYVLVAAETWDYTYETRTFNETVEWPFQNVTAPEINQTIIVPTGRVPAVKFSFDFYNLGARSIDDLEFISFMKADLYYNETGDAQDWQTFALDDVVTYDPAQGLLSVVDDNDNPDFASPLNWTAMGFNASGGTLTGWEVAPPDVLLQALFEDTPLQNRSTVTPGVDDPAWAMSWRVDAGLPPGGRANISGVLGFGVGNSSVDARRRLNATLHKVYTNASQAVVTDLLAVETNFTRVAPAGDTQVSRLLVMNSGTVPVASSELWFVANYSSSAVAVELASTIIYVQNIAVGGYRQVLADWVPIDAGCYSVGWIVGGLSSYMAGVWEDAILNNYLVREVFVHDAGVLESQLPALVSTTPFTLPQAPMTTRYPGDFALINFTVVSPIPLEDLAVSVPGDPGEILDVTLNPSADLTTRVQLQVVVPFFYRPGIYALHVHLQSPSHGLEKIVPVVFEVADARGRVFYDGIHNLFGLDTLAGGNSTGTGTDAGTTGDLNISEIVGQASLDAGSLSGAALESIMGERLDTIFGNYYSFRETLASRMPKGASTVQVVSGINFTDVMGGGAGDSFLGPPAPDSGTEPGSDLAGPSTNATGTTSPGANATTNASTGLSLESVSMDLLFQESDFLSMPQNLTTDVITYDLVKFFDLVVIPDPEREITPAEVGNLTQYVAAGGNLLVLLEGSEANDWPSLDRLLHAFNLDIVGETAGYQAVSPATTAAAWPAGWPAEVFSSSNFSSPRGLFAGVTEVVMRDPVQVAPLAPPVGTPNATAVNPYTGVARYGKGRVVALGDEDIFSEALITNASNQQFLQNVADYLLGQYFNFSFALSNTTVPYREEVYIEAALQNAPVAASELATDFLMVAGFVNETGHTIDASLFGITLPVMPFLESNATTLQSFFDSGWLPETARLPHECYLVAYHDDPAGLAEFTSLRVIVSNVTQQAPAFEEFAYFTPPYPAMFDVIFLFVVLSAVLFFWVYSSKKWHSRHRFVAPSRDAQYRAENTLDEFATIVDQIQASLHNAEIPPNEKVRYVLLARDSIKHRLKNLRAIARELGEK